MSELQRKSGDAAKAIGEQTTTRASENEIDTRGRHSDVKIAAPYDALDYRLMATFPASDAVAQY